MSNKYAYNRELEEEKDIRHKNGKPREDTKIEDTSIDPCEAWEYFIFLEI